MEDQKVRPILVLVNDLIFKEKIAGAARETGSEVYFARSAGKAREHLLQHGPFSRVIVDLNFKNDDPTTLGSEFKSSGTILIGYFSHVEIELKRKAENAGFDVVVPRSVFVDQLNSYLAAK